MNSRIEAEILEPGTTFENDIDEMKYNNLDIVTSDAMNLSSIPSFDNKFDPISMNNSFEAEKFEPEPTFVRLLRR